jgi:hypothetical protein
MPLPPIAPPPRPKPTPDELAPYLRKYEHVAPSLPGAAVPPRFDLASLNRRMATFYWECDRKRENPDDFLVPFTSWIRARDPGFDYDQYLRSDQWYEIRDRVLAAARFVCAACFNRATHVHHRDYRPRVLRGEDDSPLVPMCKHHHDVIHAGNPSWQEIERRLAEIVALKDAEIAKRQNRQS